MAIFVPGPGPHPFLLTFNQFVRQQRERQLREEGEPKESGAALSASGAASGAAVGTTILPGWGTVIGAGIGAVAGPKRMKPGKGPYAQPGNIEQDNQAVMQGMMNVASAYTGYKAERRAIQQDSLRTKLLEARVEAASPEGQKRTALAAYLKSIGSTMSQYEAFKHGLEEDAQASLPDSDVLGLFASQVNDATQQAKIEQKNAYNDALADAKLFRAFDADPRGFEWVDPGGADQTGYMAAKRFRDNLRANPEGRVREADLPARIVEAEERMKPYVVRGVRKKAPPTTGKQRWEQIAHGINGTEDAYVLQPDGTGEVVHLTPKQKNNREQMASDEAGWLTDDRSIFRSVSGGKETLISTPGHAERVAKGRAEVEARRKTDLAEAFKLRNQALTELRATKRYAPQKDEMTGTTSLPVIPEGAILAKMAELQGLSGFVNPPERGAPMRAPLPGQQAQQPQRPPPPSPEQQAVAGAASFLQAIAEEEGTDDPSKWSKAMRRKAKPAAEVVVKALITQYPVFEDMPAEAKQNYRRLKAILKAR